MVGPKDNDRENPLLPLHGLLFLNSSKGSFIWTIPDRIAHSLLVALSNEIKIFMYIRLVGILFRVDPTQRVFKMLISCVRQLHLFSHHQASASKTTHSLHSLRQLMYMLKITCLNIKCIYYISTNVTTRTSNKDALSILSVGVSAWESRSWESAPVAYRQGSILIQPHQQSVVTMG